MDPTLLAALALIGGYLLGSIPFGLLLTRVAGTEDLRSIGSGNIGATNVLRTGRKGLAATTLILDAGKGAAAVLIAELLGPGLAPLAAVGAFFGHIFPVWLKFRGGKGVATYLGLALALSWPCGLAFAGAWLAMSLITRISSVGGMSGGIAATVAALLLGRIDAALVFAGLAVTVLWTHRANIGRLIAGTEPRIGRRTA